MSGTFAERIQEIYLYFTAFPITISYVYMSVQSMYKSSNTHKVGWKVGSWYSLSNTNLFQTICKRFGGV